MKNFDGFNLEKAQNKIAKEILHMANLDQEARFSNSEKIQEIDRKNTERLHKIVGKIGWPTINLVGKDASYAAWLLVQHSDHDVDFQKKCLSLMKSCVDGEVEKNNISYLEDRIRVSENLPQIYGTQFYRNNDDKLVLREIENEDSVDERRGDMGMSTLKEYKEFFYNHQQKKDE